MRSFLSKALPTMIAALFSVASLVSAENKVAYDQGYEVDETQLKGIYNTSASIDVESSWDFYANGSFIYWFAKEQGLELGTFFPTTTPLNLKPINFPFTYKPGFKVGMGTHFNHDDWNVYAQYTRLMFRKGHYVTAPITSYTIHPFWNMVPLSDLSARWKLNFNMFDLECARPYFVGKKISFTPHTGLRGGWINQRLVLGGIDATSVFHEDHIVRSNSWLLGIKAGLDTNWNIGGGFRFIGNAAGSLLYQHFKIHDLQSFYSLSVPTIKIPLLNTRDRKGQITPNFEAALGMGWGTYLDNNNWHFDLTAAYEFSYYWNQNKMRSLKDANSSFIDGDSGDLMFHGLTMNARVDF